MNTSNLESKTEEKNDLNEQEHSGIGGWLIVVLIGLFLTIIFIGSTIVNKFLPLLTSGELKLLIKYGAGANSKLWLFLLGLEFFSSLAIGAFSFITIVFFFMKKRFVPKMMIVLYAFNFVVVVLSCILLAIIQATYSFYFLEQAMDDSIRTVITSGLKCAVWIPYFIVSNRVKNTFVM